MGSQAKINIFNPSHDEMKIRIERRNQMYTPNSPKKEQEETLPEWHEPFPEPNTIPAGWNLSSMVSTAVSAAGLEDDEEGED
jgi:hypothetical protein